MDTYRNLCKEMMDYYITQPNLLHSFILSGKEPLNAFNSICQSVQSLEISSDSFTACFYNPNMDEDPICHGTLSYSSEFVKKQLFKYTKSLNLRLCHIKLDEFESLLPYLNELNCLEELQIDHQKTDDNPDITPCIREVIARTKHVKSITSSVSVFEAISQVVQDFHFEKMIVTICNEQTMERLLMLSNLFPTELDITSDSRILPVICGILRMTHNSPNFDGVKKMVLKLNNSPEDFDESALLVYDVIGLVEKILPNLEELVVEHGFGHTYKIMYMNDDDVVVPSVDVIQSTILSLSDKLKGYDGNLKVTVNWFMQYERDIDEVTVEVFDPYLRNMKEKFEGYQYVLDIDDHYLTKTVELNSKVTFKSEVLIHETEMTSEDRYQIAIDAGIYDYEDDYNDFDYDDEDYPDNFEDYY